MRRRLAPGLLLLALLALATPAAWGDLPAQKQTLDQRIAALHDRIARAQAREHSLGSQIADVNTRIKTLENRRVSVTEQLTSLESDLALHRQKLDRLNALFRLETRHYEFLRREYRVAVLGLSARVADAYVNQNPASVDVVLSASSLSDLIDQLDYLNQIGAQDSRIVSEVTSAKSEAKRERERTRRVRRVVAAETHTVAVRAEQVRVVHDQLAASSNQLAAARSSKRAALQSVKGQGQQYLSEANMLQRESSALASRIQSVQASTPYTPHVSSSGLIWPVNGPVVSPFGMRWGRLHTGIDIAVGYGTPIHASASGRVIYAGWMGGYGNLVVIDHGNGLATAYAHQSSIAAGNGSIVSQGQVIGYVGCTGHCFGPHLHFEVRVNGQAVDPMGYL